MLLCKKYFSAKSVFCCFAFLMMALPLGAQAQPVSQPSNLTIMLPHAWPSEDLFNLDRFNPTTLEQGKGINVIQGQGFKLESGMHFAINAQIGAKQSYPIECPIDMGRQPVSIEGCVDRMVEEDVCSPDTTETKQVCEDKLVDQEVCLGRQPVSTTTSGRQPVGVHSTVHGAVSNAAPAPQAAPSSQANDCHIEKIKKTVCHDETVTVKGTCLKEMRLEKVCDPVTKPKPSGETCTEMRYGNFSYTCVDIKNEGTESYFVPNATPEEFSTFYDSVVGGSLPGVTVNECARKYTPWTGHGIAAAFLNGKPAGQKLSADVCASINVPCNSSVVVSLTRTCLTSLGTEAACGTCGNDVRLDAADRALGCQQQITCTGAVCPVAPPAPVEQPSETPMYEPTDRTTNPGDS